MRASDGKEIGPRIPRIASFVIGIVVSCCAELGFFYFLFNSYPREAGR
jgi:hypothetical protein